MSADKIKIALIEDDQIIRESYTYFINNNSQMQVVGAYQSIEAALPHLKAIDPHVIFLDIELPGMNGIEGLSPIRKIIQDVYIIMLTVYDTPQNVFDALSNGAAGYLTKDAEPQKIIDAVLDVINGGGPMTSNIANLVVRSFQRSQESPLTKRETEILEQFAQGKTRTRIANEMFIDAETVKSHLKNIYAKLDVHSKADAISLAKKKKYI